MNASFIPGDTTHVQSRAVAVDGVIYCSGTRAFDPATGELARGGVRERAACCLTNLDLAASKAAGAGSKPAIVSVKAYLRNLRDTPEFFGAMRTHFQGRSLPALTLLEVNRLEDDHDIEIDAVAVSDGSGVEVIAAHPREPYATVVRSGDHVYCSAITPAATILDYEASDFLAEVNDVLAQLEARLDSAGASIADAYTTRVYVTNMKDRYLVNQAYSDHFGRNPLRVITEVCRLPGNQRVAIEAEAHTGRDRQYLSTTKGQIPTGPFTQGIRIGRYVYCSGVRPIDPSAARLVKGSFRERAVRCMENLNAILEAGGATMRQTFETRVYLRNMADLEIVDEVFDDYFGEETAPVRTVIEIARLNEDYEKGWEPNHDIEVQCSAHLELPR